jgi:hypothetical protein
MCITWEILYQISVLIFDFVSTPLVMPGWRQVLQEMCTENGGHFPYTQVLLGQAKSMHQCNFYDLEEMFLKVSQLGVCDPISPPGLLYH